MSQKNTKKNYINRLIFTCLWYCKLHQFLYFEHNYLTLLLFYNFNCINTWYIILAGPLGLFLKWGVELHTLTLPQITSLIIIIKYKIIVMDTLKIHIFFFSSFSKDNRNYLNCKYNVLYKCLYVYIYFD
jgi:hypothetical protein